MSHRLRYLYRAYRYRYRVDPGGDSVHVRATAARANWRSTWDASRARIRIGCGGAWERPGASIAFEPQPEQVAYLRGIVGGDEMAGTSRSRRRVCPTRLGRYG